MIERLRQAFALAETRSDEEQEALAELILEQRQAEERWDRLFDDPRSETLLERLASAALAEDEAGQTEEITGNAFL
jgi:hypothetical protein